LQSDFSCRLAAGLALVAALLILWFNLAAGLIGIEDDDPANLLYVGVLGIGFVGAVAGAGLLFRHAARNRSPRAEVAA